MFHLLLAIIYLSFITLGLPDGLLGSAWPVMYQEFSVPVSFSGVIFMIICGGTIVSSLQSDRLTKKLGAGKVTAISAFITAVALWGFSISSSYWMLLLWAIPYGLGAGCVDAAINNYVAIHYESRHMSWLHCMWGVGASVGPYIMSFALTGGQSWNMGYRYVAYVQVILAAILFLSLPLWKGRNERGAGVETARKDNGRTDTEAVGENTIAMESETIDDEPLSLREIIRIPGAKQVMLMFFCYCALEQTVGLWASSFLVLKHGLDVETAAGYASLFYVGITVGRAASGFITMKLNDNQMIRLGQSIVLLGIGLMCLPLVHQVALVGLIVVGLGCAPIYPCVIHSTPTNFGEDKSQAIVGVQMASAYTGNVIIPPLFGLIANHISVGLFPVYMFTILAVMFFMHVQLLKKVKK